MTNPKNSNRKAPSVSGKTEKELWVSADNQCSKCGMWLKQDKGVIGEVAHIVDESLDGFYRPDPEEKILPLTERNKIDNLILLCNNCHQTIDDKSNLQDYTIETIREIKKEHEAKIVQIRAIKAHVEYETILGFYKKIATKWVELAPLDIWENWTYGFDMSITDTPSVSFENTKIFDKLFDWLYERIWPEGVLEEIGHAFDNFRNVLFYFRRATGLYMAPERVPNRVRFVLEKPWLVITYRTQEAYDEAGKYYDSKCSLFSYLVLELTRAANYINILIRQKGVDPLFRLEEGMLITSIAFNRENLQYDNKNYIYPFKFPERFEELLKS